MTTQPSASRPARRVLVKGAAWSVPTIAVATKAHAQAASGSITLIQTGACKSPGASCAAFRFGYIFTFSSINTYPCDITITSGSVTNVVGSTPGTLTVPTPFVVPQGTSPAFTIQVNGTNSANVTFTATLTLNFLDCNGVASSTTTQISVTGTPPDCACPGPTTAAAPTESVDEEPSAESFSTEESSVEEPAAEESTSSDESTPQESTSSEESSSTDN